jgi:hypothetical protein
MKLQKLHAYQYQGFAKQFCTTMAFAKEAHAATDGNYSKMLDYLKAAVAAGREVFTK